MAERDAATFAHRGCQHTVCWCLLVMCDPAVNLHVVPAAAAEQLLQKLPSCCSKFQTAERHSITSFSHLSISQADLQ